MQPTRRFWTTAGVGTVLAVAAVAFARPLLFVPAAAVFAFLLATQVAFLHALGRFDDTLTVDQRFDSEATVADDPTTLSLSTDADAGSLSVTVRPQLAAGLVTTGEPTAELGEPLTVSINSPVAGNHRARPPEFRISDPSGLFTERLVRGDEATLRVEPREPRRMHVGEGGDALSAAFGQHTGDRGGGGLVPAELREYTAGESANRIDWKATARLATPHVREFEAETDLTTVLLVDARSGLEIGPDGETAMDYLRAAALNYLAVTRSLGDPVGCYGIDDEGVRRIAAPTSTNRGYERLRDGLSDLTSDAETGRRKRTPPLQTRAGSLDRETTFGETLAGLTSSRSRATQSDEPLAAAVQAARRRQSGIVQFVLFTDDADRAGVRNAVSAAQPAKNPLTVFLAPRVLYEPGTLADLPAAVEQYGGFEEFRSSLADIEGVRAFEVAPQDRLEAVLEASAPGRLPTA